MAAMNYAYVDGMFEGGFFGDLSKPHAFALVNKNLPVLLKNLVLWRIAQQQQEILPQHNGLTAGFNRWHKLPKAKTPIPEGKTPPFSKMDRTIYKTDVQMYGDWVRLTKHIKIAFESDYIQRVTERQSVQAAETLDSLLWDVVQEASSRGYATTGSNTMSHVNRTIAMTAGKTVSDPALREANPPSEKLIDMFERVLVSKDAEKISKAIEATSRVGTVGIPSGFIAVCHPDLIPDLRMIPGFVRVEEYASQGPIFKDEIGAVNGTRFVPSTNCTVHQGAGAALEANAKLKATNGKVDVYPIIILAADAIATVRMERFKTVVPIIVNPKPSSEDIFGQHGGIAWMTFFAGLIVDPDSCYLLHVAASSLT